MARPTKSKSERKEHMLRIRVTDEQKRAFEQAAEKDGLDVSGFIRQAAIVKARQLGVKI